MEKVVKIINIDNLKPGQVLYSDIYYYNNNVKLYNKGTILTEEKIRKLKRFGFICIKVEDDFDNQQNTNVEKDLKYITQRKIEKDLKEIYEYANYIVEVVFNNRNIKKIITKMDEGTNDHSYKVAILSTMLGLNIENLTDKCLQQLAIAALLHDIGKSTIDFSIINKPGKLTKEEFEIIKTHSKNGYDILKATEMFDPVICNAVLSHHENEDGTGYPNRIKGNEIPLYSRIIHICDVYAALTTKRCYKEAWTSEKAISILEDEKKKYEYNLLNILKNSLPIYMKGDIVYLSSGELATVTKITDQGITLKTYADQRIVNISFNEDLGDIYVKKKIRA